jgi:hypothetical protein
MNRLFFALGIASFLCVPPVFAQSNPDTSNDTIAQNWQYITHPPTPPAPASAPQAAGARAGHRRRQLSTDSDAGGGPQTQP